MRLQLRGVGCAASVVILGAVASAQVPGAAPASPDLPRQEAPAIVAPGDDSDVVVVGCVQRESDYRRINDNGRSGLVVIGVDGQFVLINASMALPKGSPIAGTRDPVPAVAAAVTTTSVPSRDLPPSAAGVAAATTGLAYQLSGPGEAQVAGYVGRWVEVTGLIKVPALVTPPPPGSGRTEPTRGDLNLRELEVASVRTMPGACAAQ